MSILESKDTLTKITKNSIIKEHIPAGIYEVHVTMEDVFLKKKDIITDSIIEIPGSESDKILQEINEFSKEEIKELYKAYGSVYKKGFLLHGRAGTGKSVIAVSAAKKLVEQRDAIVFFNPAPDYFKLVIDMYKEELKGRLICLLLEEFETVYNEYQASILSLLDGESQLDNFVTIACTNYIEQLPERIKARPSRFSTVMEIPPPSAEVRRIFVQGKLLKKDEGLLEAIVDATEGFTLDQIKDIILSVCVFKHSISDSVLKIKAMNENAIGEENIKAHVTNNYISDIKKEIRNITHTLTRRK